MNYTSQTFFLGTQNSGQWRLNYLKQQKRIDRGQVLKSERHRFQIWPHTFSYFLQLMQTNLIYFTEKYSEVPSWGVLEIYEKANYFPFIALGIEEAIKRLAVTILLISTWCMPGFDNSEVSELPFYTLFTLFANKSRRTNSLSQYAFLYLSLSQEQKVCVCAHVCVCM